MLGLAESLQSLHIHIFESIMYANISRKSVESGWKSQRKKCWSLEYWADRELGVSDLKIKQEN